MIWTGRLAGIVAVFTTLAADGCPWRTTHLSPADRAANEYAVWSAAIDAETSSEFARVVVDSVTVRMGNADFDASWGIARSLARDYETVGRQPQRVDVRRLTAHRARLLDTREAAEQAARGDTVFAHLHLSRVGFNAEVTRAVVTVTVDCGMLCGGGGTHLLARQPDGRWTLVGTPATIFY